MARVRKNHRILTCDCREIEVSGDPAINLSDDTVFQFLSEEFEGTSTASTFDENEEDEEKENQSENRHAENDRFWENQHQLLQSIIRRTSGLESQIRAITKEAVKEGKASEQMCSCSRRPSDSTCRKCLMEAVCRRLQNAGFDSAICKSKWRSSPDIPSGEHTFIDVIINNSSNPKKEMRIIIELNFRAEFEMARAHEEYDKLVKKLPEVLVGKIERLVEVLKIMSAAAKKCMKEKKMHMGPWRKHRYMQAKWLRTCQRTASPPQLSAAPRPARPTVSMLTLDLTMEGFSAFRGAAVAVG